MACAQPGETPGWTELVASVREPGPFSADAEDGLDGVGEEVDHEEPRHQPQQRVDVAASATHEHDEHVGHEAGTDPVGDGVGERHQDDGEERRDGDLGVLPVDVRHLLHHQEADQHERRYSSLARDDVHHGGEEHREQEQQAGDHARETSAGTLADTRCRLDVAGVAGHASRTTGRRRHRVHHQDGLRVRRRSVLVQQACLGADGRHGAHGVEEVGQQQREDEQERRRHTEAAEAAEQVELTERAEVGQVDDRRRQRRGVEPPALRVERLAEHRADVREPLDQDGHDRGHRDRDEDRTAHLAHPERHHEHQAKGEHQRRPAGQRTSGAQLHRNRRTSRVGDASNPSGVDEADQRDEQADAHRDGHLQAHRHGVEHRLAEARQHQEQDDQPLDDHQTHGVRPGRLGGDAERHEGVEAEAGGQSERVLGEQTHGDGHHTSHQGGAGGDCR